MVNQLMMKKRLCMLAASHYLRALVIPDRTQGIIQCQLDENPHWQFVDAALARDYDFSGSDLSVNEQAIRCCCRHLRWFKPETLVRECQVVCSFEKAICLQQQADQTLIQHILSIVKLLSKQLNVQLRLTIKLVTHSDQAIMWERRLALPSIFLGELPVSDSVEALAAYLLQAVLTQLSAEISEVDLWPTLNSLFEVAEQLFSFALWLRPLLDAHAVKASMIYSVDT